jgi:hypothetical protein
MRFVFLLLAMTAGVVEAQTPVARGAGRAAGMAAPDVPTVAGPETQVIVPVRYHHGRGQAIRPCAAPQAAPGLAGVRVGSVAPASGVAQIARPQVAPPTMPAPPSFMQPVPAQPSASEQMLGRALGSGGPPVPQQRVPCYSTDAFGRIVIQ